MKKTRLICIMLTAVLLAVGGASCSRDDDNVPAAAASNSTNNNQGDSNQGDDNNGQDQGGNPDDSQGGQNQSDDNNGQNNGDNNGGNNNGASGDWVDLGLPSGLLWATHNVGATSPEDYGDFFAWGEVSTKSVYVWENYVLCNGNYNQLIKYCNKASGGYNGFTDNLTILLSTDDAATANLGNGARMPTKEEWEELLTLCDKTWTTQNGVNGCRITASNGNTLFLPAAGTHTGDYAILFNDGTQGNYWSSSLAMDYPSTAWFFCFGIYIDTTDFYYEIFNGNRNEGCSIRPVHSRR